MDWNIGCRLVTLTLPLVGAGGEPQLTAANYDIIIIT
jgi:hypothetical protein